MRCAWRLGDRSADTFDTFEPLWQIIRGWQSFFHVTDGWLVYPSFINDAEAKLPSRAVLNGTSVPVSAKQTRTLRVRDDDRRRRLRVKSHSRR